MSLLNNSNKTKDKKKPNAQQVKPGIQAPKGNTSSKGAAGAKNTRVTGRAQRGS